MPKRAELQDVGMQTQYADRHDYIGEPTTRIPKIPLQEIKSYRERINDDVQLLQRELRRVQIVHRFYPLF